MDDLTNWPPMWKSTSKCKDIGVVDVGSGCSIDTSLCLNSRSVVSPSIYELEPTKRKRDDGFLNLKNDVSLALGLGSSGSYLEAKKKSYSDVSLDFNLNIGSKKACKEGRSRSLNFGDLERDRPKIDLQLSLSTTGATESDVTSVTLNSIAIPVSSDIVQLVDEGSTSSKWKKGLIVPILLDELQTTEAGMPLDGNSTPIEQSKSLDGPDTSHSKPSRKNSVKVCQFPGCEKGARGATGRCISHGGGRRCQRPGCPKGAEGRTAFCKAHGGGKRCEHLGCTKSAEGRTNFCIAHGGGRRCGFQDGCSRAARGRSGLCIRHGGGKRCKIENCTKSAEGLAGLCIAHGGGRRCQFSECAKGAQGSTKFCKAHGGGKRCCFVGCTKGAEGATPFCKAHGGGKRCSFEGDEVCSKSVHGGTLFCVSHGGGKRCAVAGCTKSARGRTSFCVRHGGGKRCKFDACGKSAQGSTDFCKAHGGGKRCLWAQLGDDNSPCDKFARGKIGLCAAHTAQVQDKRVHGNGTVALQMKEPIINNPVSNNVFTFGGQGHNLTPPMKNVLPIQFGGSYSIPGSLPEGRVHGGSLMAMLRGGTSVGLEPKGSNPG